MLQPERLAARQHYIFPMPGERRGADICFKSRICWYEVPERLEVLANYDGVVETREVKDGDVFIGSYNAVGRERPPGRLDYGGFTIAFHLHHVRLHYCLFDHGQPVANIYYHTARPASGALALLADALDLVIHETGAADRAERCRVLLEAILLQLRHELSQESHEAQTPQLRQAMRIKSYLEHNFTSAINCASVSEALKINRSYASTVFHAAFGMPMNQYILQLRLETAERLLTSAENLRVGEVAQICAFSDAGYFIKVFRRHYGLTPVEFRRHRREAPVHG
jgi:AraC-like DNA-binding protein